MGTSCREGNHTGTRLSGAAWSASRTISQDPLALQGVFAGWGEPPFVMGVVNVTPDSFANAQTRYPSSDAAIAHGLALLDQGADLVDVGGESTRPGAMVISPEEEIARIRPVVAALARKGARVSLDTRNVETMRVGLGEGAHMINDVSALRHGGKQAMEVVARAGCKLILMHMQGDPRTMQLAPSYVDPLLEVRDFLAERIAICQSHGIRRENILIDPGFGFGKLLHHNLWLLAKLDVLKDLQFPIVIGVSRKSMIGQMDPRGGAEPEMRLAGSIAAGLAGIDRGATIVRVHDVAQTCQAIHVWRAIRAAGNSDYV